MNISTIVQGFRPPDEKFKKFAAIWKQCEEAGIDPPKEVEEFFNYEAPDPQGVEVRLKEGKDGCLKEWRHPSGDAQGYEVDLTKLPKDVTVIRFYNGW
jgi:hypothetical protein